MNKRLSLPNRCLGVSTLWLTQTNVCQYRPLANAKFSKEIWFHRFSMSWVWLVRQSQAA